MNPTADSGASRIRSLDFLRGAAVLGMLVANIPWHAGNSMSRVSDPDATSVTAWLLQYLIFDQRFMPIFCMLFGAAVLLQAERPGAPTPFAPYYLVRMAVLFVIGVLHAYLLWPGDILITYTVCAPFLLLGRHMSVAALLTVGVLLKGVDVVFAEWPRVYDLLIHDWLFAWWVDYGEAPGTLGEAYEGSYLDLLAFNAWRNQYLQWTALPYFRIWNAMGLMFIGMALFRLGILQGARSPAFYKRLFWVSLAIGLPLVVYGVMARTGINDTVGPYLGFTQTLPLREATFLTGCAITSLAMIAVLHLAYQRISLRAAEAVERVGRMALTNYLMHSLIFVLVFHTFGLLPFDEIDHDKLLMLVIGTWVFQLGFSWWWLSYFKQGPVEAVWRQIARQALATQTRQPQEAEAKTAKR